MIETKDIIKMVAHIVRHDNGVPDTRIMHPLREWLIGLVGVTVGVACGSVFAGATYHAYSLSTRNEIEVIETAVPYKAALVDQALETYLAKQAVYEKLIVANIVPIIATQNSTSTNVVIETEVATSSPEVNIGDAQLREAVNKPVTADPDLAI